MAITAKPEIISPRRRLSEDAFDDEHMDMLSHLLDDFIRIPGTSIRFGLDGIVGFIPGLGDILGGLASSIIIIAAWVRGVPKVVVTRMVLNVAIETAAGALPFIGNLFDIGWRANRRNYALLTSASANPNAKTLGSWLYIGGVCLVLLVLMVVPMVLAGWVLKEFRAGMAAGH